MTHGKTLIWLLAPALSFLLLNCSQGNPADTIYICEEQTTHYTSVSGPIPADLSGSYTMSGFDFDYYTAFGNYVRTIRDSELDAASGTMVISPAFADVSYSLVGTVHLTENWYLIFNDWSYTFLKGSVSWIDSTSGTVILEGLASPFTASGDKLSITFPIYCFLLEETVDSAPSGTP